jgi:regulator of protease activity HflC (stomatin/prohibitin superfamily)
MIQQGDVLLIPIQTPTAEELKGRGVKRTHKDRMVLALGEVTGHRRVKGRDMFSTLRGLYQRGQAAVSFGITMVLILLVLGLVLLASACTPIKFGTVGAVTQWGELTGTVFTEGMNFKTPLIQGVETFDTQNQTYEVSEHPEESKADYTDFPIGSQTADGQQIEITYTVVFRVEGKNVITVLRTWGDMRDVLENVIKADSRSWVRKLAQNYSAESLYSGEGIVHFENDVRAKLFETYTGAGITLDEILIRKISFDPDYILAIEQQQIAQELIETASFQAQAAEYQRDQAILLSQGDKEREILLAQAEAQQIVLRAEAEAKAIVLQGEALRLYPEVIQWQFVNSLTNVQWGFLPTESITPLLPIPPGFGQ